MAYKKKIHTLIYIIIGLALLAYVLTVLRVYNSYCYSDLICSVFVIKPLIFGKYSFMFIVAITILPYLLLLLFCKEAIYRAWMAFTIGYTPIFLLMILFALGGSGGMSGIGEGFAFFLAGLYSLISLLIIIIQSIRLAGKPEAKREGAEQKQK